MHLSPATRWIARRACAFVVAASIAVSGTLVRVPPVQANIDCTGLQLGSRKVYIDKDSSELGNFKFDYVRGDATVGNLGPCIGFSFAGGAYILMANMERASGTQIVQIGYGKRCTLCADDFYYTPGGQGAAVAWPGNLAPQSGHRVRGVISKLVEPGGDTNTTFTLVDLTDGITQTATVGTWYPSYDKAWWGAETADNRSEIGVDSAGPDSNMAYMGYSTTQNGTIFYRSGMVFNACYCENQPPGSGPSDIEKQGAVMAGEHGHLGNWVFGNDMTNFESHFP